MIVLLLGAAGLVGREVLSLLIEDDSIERIHLLSRRSVRYEHPKLKEFINPLDAMKKSIEDFQVDAVLCCLETTIKAAGSRDQFRLVDLDYPLDAAKLAKENQVETFAVITSLGANSKSIIFYSRVKGELEENLSRVGFKNLHIVRPSILVGERKESRPGESAGIFFAQIAKPLFLGLFENMRVPKSMKLLVS